MEPPSNWLDPSLSLCTEFHQEYDRRAAAHMNQHQLHELADKLIVDWYRQQTLLAQCLKQVRILEVKLALASAPPARHGPDEQHLRMARELLSEG